MKKLEGKVALVTGGNSGIGLATAKRFVEEGAYVYITGRRKEQLEEAIKQIGSNVTGFLGDISDLAEIDRLYALIQEKHGRVDVIFANAGTAEFLPLSQVTEEHFDTLFRVNVKGVLFTVQKALPLLSNGASIILNSSINGSIGQPATSVYGATKAALRNFVRTWILDLKDQNIRFNVVSPGPVETTGLAAVAGPDRAAQTAMFDFLKTTVPMGRLAQPEEIAKAVLFLASDDSSFVSGTELFVDGGSAQI